MNEIIDSMFKLTPKGIHLIRNKYTYHLINYNEVENAYLTRGKSVRNWIIIAAFGCIILSIALFLSLHLINSLSIEEKPIRFYNVFGHGLIAVTLLGGAGIVSIFNAFKTVPIIKIITKDNAYNLRILKNQKSIMKVLDWFNSYGITVKKRDFSD